MNRHNSRELSYSALGESNVPDLDFMKRATEGIFEQAAPAQQGAKPGRPTTGAGVQGPGGGDEADVQAAVGHYVDINPTTNPYAAMNTFGFWDLEQTLDQYETEGDSVAQGNARMDQRMRQRKFEDENPVPRDDYRDTPAGYTASEKAAWRVRDGYAKKSDLPEGKFDDDTPLDMSSPEERLKVVSNLSQDMGNDKRDAMLCGPSSIISAMIIAKGEEGIGDIVTALEKDETMKGKFDDLKERLAKGLPVTPNDFVALKSALGDHFAKDLPADKKDKGGSNPASMDKFINGNEAIQQAFAENNMEIGGVDRMDGRHDLGGNGSEHAVLIIRDDDGEPMMVYDPQRRKSSPLDRKGMGSQVIQDKSMLEDYDKIRPEYVNAHADDAPPTYRQ